MPTSVFFDFHTTTSYFTYFISVLFRLRFSDVARGFSQVMRYFLSTNAAHELTSAACGPFAAAYARA